MCNEGFTKENRPTLDRIDNKLNHSKSNVKPCCLYCNKIKSDKDEKTQKLYIQLRKIAVKNHLPMTLHEGQEGLYRFLREGIVGALSNVHPRENIRGKTII
jgi:ribosome-interacting GTPase 1